jgi:serine/threonine-protein kinase
VYELGEREGRPYLVEELLEGETFRQVIERRKLPPEIAVELAIQIADGLKAAHAKGLVHRDIKPANLFLAAENRVKILDFGLVKQSPISALSTDEGDALRAHEATTVDTGPDDMTLPGRIVGTLDYMSPEQVRGEAATPSSDIFSLGIVLYELLNGSHPFKRKSPLETASAILVQPLESDTMVRAIAEIGLHTVLEKMLAKDARSRYADGGELLAELKLVHSRYGAKMRGDLSAGWSGPATVRQASIAVLPFANLSGDASNDFFCEGLAEELIRVLAKVEGLKVAAWTSAFRFRAGADIREVGKQLGVQTVFEGSLRTSGSRLRVNVKLLDAESGYHIWSERYDREMHDVFAIQEEIAGAIVEQLGEKLGLTSKPAIVPRPSPNVEAYNLYLKGRYFWNRRRPADIQKAVESFREALRVDERFAPALAGLADCYVVTGVQGATNPKELFPFAREAATKALAIDPQMGEALASLASVEAVYDWNWKAAEESFRKALEFSPQYGTAHHWYATHLLAPQGRFDEARTQLEKARANDPLSLAIQVTLGLVASFEGDPDRAIAEYRKALDMDANFWLAHYFLGQAYEQKRSYEIALRSLLRAVELTPQSSEMEAVLGRVQAESGDHEAAEKTLLELQNRSRQRYVSPILRAHVLVGLGRNEEAIAELQQAQELRASDLIWLQVRPSFAGIREDPRVRQVALAMGLT